VLLEGQALQVGEARRVVPREVGVGLDHARHEGRAGAVDHRHARRGQRARTARDSGDAVPLHQHLARVGLRAGAVDQADVGEEHAGHGWLLYMRWA
jgi:hypothetical protein